ncbi:MAG TPA: serine hydrolase domain-containing protein, partial [Anaerolineae bacterium]|nr:serine hydrolase domain-containing protein [Anaerolineae bacterium]
MKPSTGLWRLLCLLATVISTTMLTVPVAATASDPFAAALDDKMPGWLSTYDVPGAVVSYIEDGAVAWTRAYGVKDATTQAPMTPEAIFNHGSNGKTLTAWGVMHLVEEGRIELDAPAEKYLKRWHFPPSQFDVNQVTIRRLLSHTAGLGVHGYPQYDLRRPLPALEQVLSGQNQDQPPL